MHIRCGEVINTYHHPDSRAGWTYRMWRRSAAWHWHASETAKSPSQCFGLQLIDTHSHKKAKWKRKTSETTKPVPRRPWQQKVFFTHSRLPKTKRHTLVMHSTLPPEMQTLSCTLESNPGLLTNKLAEKWPRTLDDKISLVAWTYTHTIHPTPITHKPTSMRQTFFPSKWPKEWIKRANNLSLKIASKSSEDGATTHQVKSKDIEYKGKTWLFSQNISKPQRNTEERPMTN